MAKVKSKKRQKKLSDVKSTSTKKINPFEVHVNRQKYNVVGRKLKSDRGLPGIARSKAMKKRKATLLQEYKIKDKSNRFFDRRIGERNAAMTAEDRVIARFTAERMKMFNKKQIFNLADDEILTHHGQTLSEIEKFDDPRSDDDEDDDALNGKLGAEFVGDAHFGGGVLKRADEGEKKSRKDLIEELIAESKKRKAEKQRTREQTMELTEKLDTEWRDLLPIVAASKKKKEDELGVDKPDSYDTVMQKLRFEARGQASNPLKSEQEIQEEAAKQKAELEAERERRMFESTKLKNVVNKHRSADDLDDGFCIEENNDEFELCYNLEGKMQIPSSEKNSSITQVQDKDSDGDVVEEEDDISEGRGNEEEDDDDDDDDDEDDDDSLSDLRPSDSDQEADEANVDNFSSFTIKALESITVNANNGEQTDLLTKSKPVVSMSRIRDSDKNEILQKAIKNYPHLVTIPEKCKTLEKMLKQFSAVEQGIIVNHIIAKNIADTSGNRSALETLFAFLLQHIHNSASSSSMDSCHCFSVLGCLAPSLYELAHYSAKNAAESILEVITEKQEEFQKHKHTYPTLSTLVFFKVVSLLFPTSDFRHPVVTPCLVFMCQMLFQCRIKTRKDIASGLFIVALVLEYTTLSKRFSPAAINFLCGVLRLALPKGSKEVLPPVPPFKATGSLSELLVLDECVEAVDSYKMQIVDLLDGEIDNNFRVRAVVAAVTMLQEFQCNFNHLQASHNIFIWAEFFLMKLPVQKYPQCVRNEVEKLTASFMKLKEKKLQYLVVEKRRPKALRLYEPRIEEIVDVKRRRPIGKVRFEEEKLLHKIKRERKAAVREIRRDNAFLAKLKCKDIVRSDKERMEKVKEIFGSAANQQGELRSLKRRK